MATTTTKTRADLVNQALANLGVLAAGQTADTEDYDSVDSHVDQMFASLEARDVATIDDENEIPAEWFPSLSTLLADDAAAEFGAQSNPAIVRLAENTLREINRGKPTYMPLKPDYF